jgi:hypothetical protein
VKLYTVRTWMIFVFSVPHLSLGQAVTLDMKSKHRGSAVQIELLLNAGPDSAPAGLQWEFRLPPGLGLVEIEEGQAATRAGKTLACNGAKCLIYGWNRTPIPNGRIAVASIRFDQALVAGKSSTLLGYRNDAKREIKLGDLVGVSLDGKTMSLAPGIRSD